MRIIKLIVKIHSPVYIKISAILVFQFLQNIVDSCFRRVQKMVSEIIKTKRKKAFCITGFLGVLAIESLEIILKFVIRFFERSNPTARRGRNYLEFFKISMIICDVLS